ncbi:jg21963 [Pararge aegeria aegeria]|uniref:Jg21963 protein n=1 Tax=Pararge aegeria aegeria TaxID=348720 RepID=A0A8S4QZW0_9NEOP|nr:jg21963 [Pararge aegeria aegeria]
MPVSRPGALKSETSQKSFITKILKQPERCRYPHHGLRLPRTRWKNTTRVRSRRAPTSARDRALKHTHQASLPEAAQTELRSLQQGMWDSLAGETSARIPTKTQRSRLCPSWGVKGSRINLRPTLSLM